MKRITLLFAWFIYGHVVLSQEDSVWLSEVVISAFPMESYVTAGDVTEVPIRMTSQTLDDVLSRESNTYFKAYGNEQLTTIALRGTTPAQTNVLWNGLPANSPVLGQTDFSLWPVWLIDHVGLVRGSSGALFGSGSIGGTVFIDHANWLSGDPLFSGRFETGSFGKFFGGVRASYVSEKWSGKSAGYINTLKNDFTYVQKGTGNELTQKNAGVTAFGFRQRIRYVQGTHQFTGDLLVNSNDREIQPPVTNPTSRETLLSGNIRSMLSYQSDGKKGTLSNAVGFMRDVFDYNETDKTITYFYSARSQYEWATSRMQSTVGALISYALAEAENYVDNPGQSTAELFGSTRFQVTPSWVLNASVRQGVFQGTVGPLTPSIGSSLTFGSRADRRWEWHLTFSRGYRYPTLNDMFWSPGGNEELKPESSYNSETGLSHSSLDDHDRFEVQLNFFHIEAKDLIVWTPAPAGYWSPGNIQRVRVLGSELMVGWIHQWEKSQLHVGLQVSGQSSTSLSNYPTASENGNQLPYVPFLTCSGQVDYTAGNWSLALNQSWTGDRYIALDNVQVVDRFLLLDVEVNRSFEWNKHSAQIGMTVNNLLDASYENLYNRAMPGVNYQLRVHLNLFE